MPNLAVQMDVKMLNARFAAGADRSATRERLRREERRLVSRNHADGGRDRAFPLSEVVECLRPAAPGGERGSPASHDQPQRQHFHRRVREFRKYLVRADRARIILEMSPDSLIKEEMERPKYKQLLQDPFILRAQSEDVDVAAYVSEIMDEMANNGISAFTTNQP